MARIGIAAGHSGKTEGERRYEWSRCSAAAGALRSMLREASHYVPSMLNGIHNMANDDALAAKICFFNRERVDLAIELHLNAGGGSYSTALYWANKYRGEIKFSMAGRSAAGAICNQFNLTLPWRSMGARSMLWSGMMKFLHECKAPAVIVEPGFKDCAQHREWMDSAGFAQEYAAMVFLGIQKHCQAWDTV